MTRRTFEINIERDARLVLAAMNGVLEPLAISIGWTPDEALVHHPKWLRSQNKEYIARVSRRAFPLEAPRA